MSRHTVLSPSPALQKAWQLLGYKRYIARAFLRDFQQTQAEKIPEPIEEHQKNLSVEENSLRPAKPDLPKQLQSASHTDNVGVKQDRSAVLSPSLSSPQTAAPSYSSPIDLGNVQLHIIHNASLLLSPSTDVLLLLPSLYWQADAWRVFASQEEGQLLQNAFHRLGFTQISAMLSPVITWQSQEAPHATSLQISPPKICLCLGDEQLWQIGQQWFSHSKSYRLSHPALALKSGAYKRRLWQELFSLKGNLT